MAFMTWTKDMSVGVAVFDLEHKKLIGMIDELLEGIQSGSARLTLNRVFEELIGSMNVTSPTKNSSSRRPGIPSQPNTRRSTRD